MLLTAAGEGCLALLASAIRDADTLLTPLVFVHLHHRHRFSHNKLLLWHCGCCQGTRVASSSVSRFGNVFGEKEWEGENSL